MDETGVVQDVRGAALEAAIQRGGLVLVDFTAAWCPPCQAMAPHVAELAARHAGRVAFAKVDVDRDPAAAEAHGVESIPTLVMFRDGTRIGHRTGYLAKEAMDRWIQRSLG